jgi:hypothetical protein
MGGPIPEACWGVTMSNLESELLDAIHALDLCVWRKGVDGPTIEQWLKEFGTDGLNGSRGRLHALYLLSRFMYFGNEEVRALLRALFRDHYRHPIVAEIRRNASNTRDREVIDKGFRQALSHTRFLGMGNPSESGTHLLYHYRQENGLTPKSFISTHEALDLTQKEPTLADPSVNRYIFIDDFCGSGVQAVRYSKRLLQPIADAAIRASIKLSLAYHVLLGTSKGIQRVQTETRFTEVACVLELDESFSAFHDGSRFFRSPPPEIDRSFAHALASRFGRELAPTEPLGFDDAQLMLGFVHNTPNNTLPIFWHPGHDRRTWHPVFRRYPKVETSTTGCRR